MIRRPTSRVGVVVVALFIAVRADASAQWTGPGDCRTLSTRHFALHSDPWINLHHFLFEWARNDPDRRASDRRRPVDVPERSELAALDEAERSAWTAALRVYGERLVASELFRDPTLVALRSALAQIDCPAATPAPTEPWRDVRGALDAAMPVYRRHWWPRHHAANRAWAEETARRLDGVESALGSRLADAYGGRWPSERVRVDATAYAAWSGAYTTNEPDQVTISSRHPLHAGWTAVDVLFHEVSHASFFEQPLLRRVQTAFGTGGGAIPNDLDHVLQFVTPAELLRPLLPEPERAAFRPYAEQAGLYLRNPTWARYRDAAYATWVPALGANGPRDEVLRQLAATLALAPAR